MRYLMKSAMCQKVSQADMFCSQIENSLPQQKKFANFNELSEI